MAPDVDHTLSERAVSASTVEVLVVDDDECVRSSIAEILRVNGYSTAEAEDGLSALEFMQEVDVGVLVLDMRMPHLDGFGLLDRLYDPPPVILVSAYSRNTDPRVATAAIYWYLCKPLQPRTLLDAVGKALGRADLRDSDTLAPGTPVDVRSRYVGEWATGFEVQFRVDEGYIIRRLSDGSLLPSVLASDDLSLHNTSKQPWVVRHLPRSS